MLNQNICFAELMFNLLINSSQLKRYKTYAYLLRSKMAQYPELEPSLVETSIGEVDERGECESGIVPPPIPDRPLPRATPTNRYSYRAAIYNSGRGNNGGGASPSDDIA
jgi:hypothetical protein